MAESKDDGPASMEGPVREYPGVSLKRVASSVTLDMSKDALVITRDDRLDGIGRPVRISVDEIEGVYVEDRKRLSPSVFRAGLIMVFLVGVYLVLAEYITIPHTLEMALYIFFFGISGLGFLVIVIYMAVKEKVLAMDWKGDRMIFKGPQDELGRLRFDVHVQAKGRFLGDDGAEEGTDGSKGIPRGREKKKQVGGADGEGGKTDRIIRCPQCGSGRLYYEAGLMTGYKYHCKRCDYIGSFVIETEMPPRKEK